MIRVDEWRKSDPETWGDDIEDIIAVIADEVKKAFCVDLTETYTIDTESVDAFGELYDAWDAADKTKVADGPIYLLWSAEINGHNVLGSNWDGILWIVAKEPFQIG